MQSLPKSLEKFIHTIQAELPILLGDTLFGLYIYGSISYNAFDRRKSDVDIIAVLHRPLNDREFKKIRKFYKTRLDQNWVKRLEMDYVVLSSLKDFSLALKNGFKATHLAHGTLHHNAFSDGGNPLNWLNIYQTGITLFGPLPKKFVPVISEKIILAGQRRAFEEMKSLYHKWMKRDVWHQVYMVVMMNRIACALRTGRILSKAAAAHWGLKNLPQRFRPLMSITLKKIAHPKGKPSKEISAALPELMEYVDMLFKKKSSLKARFVKISSRGT